MKIQDIYEKIVRDPTQPENYGTHEAKAEWSQKGRKIVGACALGLAGVAVATHSESLLIASAGTGLGALIIEGDYIYHSRRAENGPTANLE